MTKASRRQRKRQRVAERKFNALIAVGDPEAGIAGFKPRAFLPHPFPDWLRVGGVLPHVSWGDRGSVFYTWLVNVDDHEEEVTESAHYSQVNKRTSAEDIVRRMCGMATRELDRIRCRRAMSAMVAGMLEDIAWKALSHG